MKQTTRNQMYKANGFSLWLYEKLIPWKGKRGDNTNHFASKVTLFYNIPLETKMKCIKSNDNIGWGNTTSLTFKYMGVPW